MVTSANAIELEADSFGQPQKIDESHIEVAALDPLPSLARIHMIGAQLNFETEVSLQVMNSSRAGSPRSVASMPRLIAGTISEGSVTRSP
jgi:hypothetical protein